MLIGGCSPRSRCPAARAHQRHDSAAKRYLAVSYRDGRAPGATPTPDSQRRRRHRRQCKLTKSQPQYSYVGVDSADARQIMMQRPTRPTPTSTTPPPPTTNHFPSGAASSCGTAWSSKPPTSTAAAASRRPNSAPGSVAASLGRSLSRLRQRRRHMLQPTGPAEGISPLNHAMERAGLDPATYWVRFKSSPTPIPLARRDSGDSSARNSRGCSALIRGFWG